MTPNEKKSRESSQDGRLWEKLGFACPLLPQTSPSALPPAHKAELSRSVSNQAAFQQILDYEKRNGSPHHNHTNVKKTIDHFRFS